MFCKDVRPTQQSGHLRRHGVLHGREVAYNTIENSTKALVCLISVIEWAKPRADQLAVERKAEYNAKWSGSGEADELGRQRDNRGFPEAKAALLKLHSFQFGYFKRNGHYCDTAYELDAISSTNRWDDLEVRVSDDGKTYFAWLETPSGWAFGVGGADGEFPHFEYDGPQAPDQALGGELDWRHSGSDMSPPNW